jgi:alpha-tubulin suppressor-like RCC1 family protein
MTTMVNILASGHPGIAASTLAVAMLGACGLAACGGGTGSSPSATTTLRASHTVVYTFGVAGTQGPVIQTEHEAPTPISGIVGSVVEIATSNSDTYALTSAGTVWAWGVGSYGELGNGSTPLYTSAAVEVDFPKGVMITSLPNPMPFDGGLAIDSQGDAWGWGLNDTNDLCLPSGTVVSRPEKIPLANVTLATGARTHSMFDSDGTVYACGSGEFGELGNGSTSSSSRPTPVVGLPKGGKVKALTSSWGGSGALMADGSYYDWGYNQAGQLGNGTTTDSAVPVHVALPAEVEQVFQGGSGAKNGQSIAILANGTLWTWGNGTHGQLGDGTTDSSTTPIRITLPRGAKAAKVSSGGYASYAIDTSGKLWAWGRNDDGQLGTGSSGPDHPTPVSTGLSLTQISSTAQNAAGLRQH